MQAKEDGNTRVWRQLPGNLIVSFFDSTLSQSSSWQAATLLSYERSVWACNGAICDIESVLGKRNSHISSSCPPQIFMGKKSLV